MHSTVHGRDLHFALTGIVSCDDWQSIKQYSTVTIPLYHQVSRGWQDAVVKLKRRCTQAIITTTTEKSEVQHRTETLQGTSSLKWHSRDGSANPPIELSIDTASPTNASDATITHLLYDPHGSLKRTRQHGVAGAVLYPPSSCRYLSTLADSRQCRKISTRYYNTPSTAFRCCWKAVAVSHTNTRTEIRSKNYT